MFGLQSETESIEQRNTEMVGVKGAEGGGEYSVYQNVLEK